MTEKAIHAGFLGALEDAGVTISPDVINGGLQRTTEQLRRIEFSVQSPDQDVTVLMAASGAIREVNIAEGAFARRDHIQMAALITSTIKRAENVMITGVRELFRRQLANRRQP